MACTVPRERSEDRANTILQANARRGLTNIHYLALYALPCLDLIKSCFNAWPSVYRCKTDSCNDTTTKCFGPVTEPQLSASRVTLPLHFFFARCARTHGNRHVVTCRPYAPVAHLTVCGPHVGWGAVYTAAGHSYHSHSKQHAHVHVLDRSLSSNSRLRGGGTCTCCVQMCTAQRACAGHTKITRRAGQW